MAESRLCSIEGCGKQRVARGWCTKHWHRWRAHGDPLALKTAANGEATAFYEQVALPYERDDCLLWPFARAKNGYGFLRREGKQNHVHRLVCIAVNGPPPTPHHHAAHECGVRACVNPRHLSWKTPKANTDDCFVHGTRNRGKWSRPTRCRAKWK